MSKVVTWLLGLGALPAALYAHVPVTGLLLVLLVPVLLCLLSDKAAGRLERFLWARYGTGPNSPATPRVSKKREKKRRSP